MKVVCGMAGTPQREALPITAYEWCLENVSPFLSLFNETRQKENAFAEYHPMVDGIVWSDELPNCSAVDSATLKRVFCVLIHTRTSQILDEAIPPFGLTLLNTIQEACPQWSFNDPYRICNSRRSDIEKLRGRFFRRMDRLKCSSDG